MRASVCVQGWAVAIPGSPIIGPFKTRFSNNRPLSALGVEPIRAAHGCCDRREARASLAAAPWWRPGGAQESLPPSPPRWGGAQAIPLATQARVGASGGCRAAPPRQPLPSPSWRGPRQTESAARGCVPTNHPRRLLSLRTGRRDESDLPVSRCRGRLCAPLCFIFCFWMVVVFKDVLTGYFEYFDVAVSPLGTLVLCGASRPS